MYYVSRQHYYYQDIYVVEIAYPSIDYSSPDMLIYKYKGEGETFNDPREALAVAVEIRKAWQKDTEKEIGITYGSFDGIEGEPYEDIEELKQTIQKEYDSLPKCDYCNELIDGKEYYINPDSEFSGEKFCSESHAERAYLDGYDFCYICEKEFQRKEMDQYVDDILFCDSCKNLQDSYQSIEIEKLNDDSFVGYSLEDQLITRTLLNKTYLSGKDFSNLKDMLEKLVIDIYVVDEDDNIIEEIKVG